MAHNYRLFQRKNGYFYHRVKVPADIRVLYGKEIEQVSLGTCDLRAARKLLPGVMLAVDQRFIDFREQHKDRLDHIRFEGATVPPKLPPLRQQSAMDKRPKASVLGGECFAELKREKAWSEKTDTIRKTQLRLFIEICGDKPLADYTQADIRQFKRTLSALPPGAHSKKMFANLSKREIAGKAREQGLPGLSLESVRQNMTTVSILFGWARANHQATLVNIVQPMIPPPPNGLEKRNNRDAFSIEDLKHLFALPLFHGVKSVQEWNEAGFVSMKGTGRYWIPFLSLYAGTRLMEAVQLTRNDVGCEEGIWFIDINDDGDDKRVKNGSSLRRIPVHPELIELGFIDFVQTVQVGARLFPDIEIGPPAQRQRYASKFFNRLLVAAKIKSSKKVWHSMRHTFEQACRDSGIDAAIMDQLQGHSQKGMRGVYGAGYGLASLARAVSAIAYKGVDACANDLDGYQSTVEQQATTTTPYIKRL